MSTDLCILILALSSLGQMAMITSLKGKVDRLEAVPPPPGWERP